MSRLAVFAYASLVDPASAAETLERPVEFAALARLEGWSRGWTVARDNSASEKTFARLDGSLPDFCLGLDLAPDPGAAPPNGVLIEVTEVELARLDLREIRYSRFDVTEAIVTDAEGFDATYAYRARPEHHRPEPPPGSIIISTYPAAIEAAFAALGPDQLELYRATTVPPPVEVVEATLIADAIPEGNPRAW
ncbi:MAG: gamma-glutamylcyclotransferase family protein [Solirubrobacterales bacterium]